MTDKAALLPDVTLTVKDSKLYELARQEQLLAFLIPSLPIQMTTEAELDENFVRTIEDGNATRILITYRNVRGNSAVFKLIDTERLARKFDIDHFMNGYLLQIGLDQSSDDIVDNVNSTVLSALNMAVSAALSIDEELKSDDIKLLSENIIKVLVSLIFDDPCDVFIAFNEQEPRDDKKETTSVIVGMWMVKQRSDEEPIDTNVDLLEPLDRDLPEDLGSEDDSSVLELTKDYVERSNTSFKPKKDE